MLRSLFLGVALLSAQEPAGPVPAPTPSEAAALAEYNAIRDKTPDTAVAQWKLALWCEQKGLKPEAYVHFGRVIALDPKREAAWQRLGYKKHEGRWMTPEQIAEEAELRKAEKTWLVALKKAHKEIHGGKKQAEAQAALDAITDPSAVPAIYREFGGGGPRDQEIAIQLLGQVDSPAASKALATLAVYGRAPIARRLATETLRGRKPEDFLDLLVALMKDPLRYEVRPVGGPGSPGVLFVEGERFNVRRFYAPPTVNYQPRPGDAIGYDENGMPTITRSQQINRSTTETAGVPGSKTLVTSKTTTTTGTTVETFSFGQAIAEAQRGAAVAQVQLVQDIARIDDLNAIRKQFSELVIDVARAATGKDRGSSPKAWREALAAVDPRYAPRPTRTPIRPTLDEVVPLAYTPDLSPTMSIWSSSKTSFLTRTFADS